jgi:hypothetical protein
MKYQIKISFYLAHEIGIVRLAFPIIHITSGPDQRAANAVPVDRSVSLFIIAKG